VKIGKGAIMVARGVIEPIKVEARPADPMSRCEVLT